LVAHNMEVDEDPRNRIPARWLPLSHKDKTALADTRTCAACIFELKRLGVLE